MTVDRDDRDAELLRMAVRLALRGHGLVEPNPMVGCVVLDASGRIAGLGHHRRVGGPHAEIEALAAAGERARGGSLLVTLEPCNHQGRTGLDKRRRTIGNRQPSEHPTGKGHSGDPLRWHDARQPEPTECDHERDDVGTLDRGLLQEEI